MLIPSIDLKDGAVVQLVQGERLAIKDDDVFRWVRKFEKFPKVQVIDLDAAMGTGDNLALVRQIARRSPAASAAASAPSTARAVLAAGAQQIIAGSSLFKDGAPDLDVRRARCRRGRPRARDRRRGQPRRPRRDSRLENHPAAHRCRCGSRARAVLRRVSLYARGHRGPDGRDQLRRYCGRREATTRRVTAAGGITTQAEIDRLHALGVDAVVGMAIYTGALSLDD